MSMWRGGEGNEELGGKGSKGDETFFNVGLQAVDSAEKLYFSVSTR